MMRRVLDSARRVPLGALVPELQTPAVGRNRVRVPARSTELRKLVDPEDDEVVGAPVM